MESNSVSKFSETMTKEANGLSSFDAHAGWPHLYKKWECVHNRGESLTKEGEREEKGETKGMCTIIQLRTNFVWYRRDKGASNFIPRFNSQEGKGLVYYSFAGKG